MCSCEQLKCVWMTGDPGRGGAMVMVTDTGVVIKSWDNESLTSGEMEMLEKEGFNLTAVAGAETLTPESIRCCSVVAVVLLLLCIAL